ncbi:MAG: PQQ-binding-like beta-propeller repeat protein, partial [Kiritimatiellae bacterium]|nr:PQQ-binding-like beta-propeller repeat protein [Kiritimatiellia bacterium]
MLHQRLSAALWRIAPAGLAAAGVWLAAGGARAGDWPQWHGPNRTGVTPESSGWSSGAWNITELWRTGSNGVINVGFGTSTPLIVKRAGDSVPKVYFIRWSGDRDRLICLNGETGQKLWEESYACPDYGRTANANKTHYRGVNATPAMDVGNGYLYTLSCDGDLSCWDTTQSSSRAVWTFNLHSRFGGVPAAESEDYGFIASPLLYGNWVIVQVGDEQGNLMAFNKSTGATVWKSANTDDRGWGSPALVTVAGKPCVAAMTRRNFLVVRADAGHEGETLMQYAWKATYSGNIPSPIVSGSRVFFARADGSGSCCAAVDLTLSGYTKPFETTDWWWGVSTAVLHGNYIYTPHVRTVRCRTLSGAHVWASGNILETPHSKFDAASAIVCAGDDKMLVYDGLARGRLRLVEATPSPASYRELARIDGVLTRVTASYHCGYSRLAMGHGKIICNNIDGQVVCFAASGGAAAPDAPSGLSAAVLSSTSIQLTWTDNSGDET